MKRRLIFIFCPKLDAPRKICNTAQFALAPPTESVSGGKAILGTAKTERRAQIVDTLAALVAQHTSTSRTNRATPQLRVEGSSICACYMCQFGKTKTRLSPFLPQKGAARPLRPKKSHFAKDPRLNL